VIIIKGYELLTNQIKTNW